MKSVLHSKAFMLTIVPRQTHTIAVHACKRRTQTLQRKTLGISHAMNDSSMSQMDTGEQAKPTLKLRDRCSSSSKMAATFPHLQWKP